MPVSVLYLAVGAILVLLVGGGYLSQVFFSRHTDRGRMELLIKENYLLKARLTASMAVIDTFRQFLAMTEEMDNKLRAATDLYLIPKEVRKMGVGGEVGEDENPDLAELLRRARLGQYSLSQIEQVLKARRSELSCIPSIWPVRGWVTSWFGMRKDPFTGVSTMHEGMDIVAPHGTPVVATADGRVVFAGWHSGWGQVVEIDHGNGLVTFYAHCASLKVKVGEEVTRGQVIATVGSSGRTTGTHLHYGMKRKGAWVNPRNYIIIGE